ncbi:MAG: TetR/AcrR family transcriptional regulator [Acidimicrobiales bacterium]
MTDATRRQRNPRGQGAHLRDEIVAGALVVLERTGSEEAVSLRAIAREIGIASPSIARHFSDVPEIIDAVVATVLSDLYQAIVIAAARSDDPVERLFHASRSYVNYGRTHPARYRVLIGRRYLDDWHDRNLTMEQTSPIMARCIAIFRDTIQACVDTGRSASTDVNFDTLVSWFSLHGVVALPAAITSLDWPDDEDLLVASVTRAARLIEPS